MHALPRLRKLLLAILLVGITTPSAWSTWSIVVVDTATGEVCIASATCLGGLSLRDNLGVVRVGVGAAAAQSFVDTTGVNRRLIWDGFIAQDSPTQILSDLALSDGAHQSRQYGIVDMTNTPVTFTGAGAFKAKHQVSGVSGSLRYAIQGNVLTGKVVVTRARQVLLGAPGDLGQRVLVAMQQAKQLGGDGRCSCNINKPNSCGAPPPKFKTSATIGFMVIARLGDTDGVCDGATGCVNGDYYLNLDVTPGQANVDPVDELQTMYDAWRADLSGRPDQQLSLATPERTTLPADGSSGTAVLLQLVDVDGVPLTQGGARIVVTSVREPSLVDIGPVVDHGDGSYSFRVKSRRLVGRQQLRIVAKDGVVSPTLHPFVEIELTRPHMLQVPGHAISTSSHVDVPFEIDAGSGAAGSYYLLLGSLSGTSPGTSLSGISLPLNPDPLFQLTLASPNSGPLPGSAGLLDPLGRAEAHLVAGPSELDLLAGAHLDWAVVLPAHGRVSNVVGLDLTP